MADRRFMRPFRASGVAEFDLGDELLVYIRCKAVGVALNRSSKQIWSLCDGNRTPVDMGRQIGDALAVRDNVLAEILISDILSALEQLHDLGALGWKDSACPGIP